MKRPYEKPRIQKVKLIAEEAILVTCKTSAERSGRTCTSGGCAGAALATS